VKTHPMALYVICGILAWGVGGCGRDAGPERTIAVVMKKYSIEPAEIRVRQGEAVELEVRSEDVQHGFDVPELKVTESVPPGKVARFRLPTERKGRFLVECGVLCGPRHEQMRGVVIVE
jgi:heme/copper-type cytochrome/quinol oxidase subunit 2